MKYVVTEVAEWIAISICWLARQPGLPNIHGLRVGVVTMHETPCGWCDYPLPELTDMLKRRDVDEDDERRWGLLPAARARRAVELAQGRDDTPVPGAP
jgi:hypothetical protein